MEYNEENLEMINVQLLSNHPRNKEIYGEERTKELADKIKESGFINPLIITKKDGKNIIISGHRRAYACISLGYTEVPIRRVKFKSDNEELERLLLENEYREKTLYQKTKEAEIWEEIERKKAKQRQAIAGSKNLGLVVVNGTQLGNNMNVSNEKGKTRDIIAEKAGISSGSTYKRAKYTVRQINKLVELGETKDANFLISVLNENARASEDLVKNNSLSKISDELKDKVIGKEITVQKAIASIRKDLKIVTDNMKKHKIQNDEAELVICRQCKEEKSIYDFYEGKSICKDCHNENNDKNRNPKNVYGNEIKIDKEKLKGIDIEALIANAKDTNKNISMTDYDSTSMEFSCNIDMFIMNISKYTEESDIYKLSEIDKDNKNKLLKSITDMENIMNKLKNILI